MASVTLRPGRVALADLRAIACRGAKAVLDPACRGPVDAAAAMVEGIVAKGDTVYGINTGFGSLARSRISDGQLSQLQANLVLSHATGLGPLLDDAVVRLVLALKMVGLGAGHSGVRWRVIETLQALLQAEIYPCIPAKGSVGASGDLAPLAHLSCVLIGRGRARHKGGEISGEEALNRAGVPPLTLGPKEGLALLNGTQVSTALALVGLFAIEDAFAAATVSGALATDAVKGSDAPFDPRIHRLRGHAGQKAMAETYRRLLAGSAIRRSHLECDRVQDPYSLRCQPQVMGACLDQIAHAAGVLEIEAGAVTDNPLLFPADGDALSGGNFHAEPVALAADALAIAVAEVTSLCERRIALLIDATLSGLPPFLVDESGVNSGFMVAHVTAAALASENKSLAHPASVDSLPTSANQEDHVSMAAFAARRLGEMAANAQGVIAIELLAAAQGMEFHRPLESSAGLESAMGKIRALVPRLDADRMMAPDMQAIAALIAQGGFHDLVPGLLPSC